MFSYSGAASLILPKYIKQLLSLKQIIKTLKFHITVNRIYSKYQNITEIKKNILYVIKHIFTMLCEIIGQITA